jgi:hypothetical protein
MLVPFFQQLYGRNGKPLRNQTCTDARNHTEQFCGRR